MDYEKNLLIHSSSEVAIDGHAIRFCSNENDLAETGYKFGALGEDQANYLMGYDINWEKPLFTRMFRGSCYDKSTIAELTELPELNNILFAVDRGFYSESNLKLMSKNGNHYIIPVPSHLKVFKKSMAQLKYTNYFYYVSGKKHARIQYCEQVISDTERILIFRDVDENEKCRYNDQHCIEQGKTGYIPSAELPIFMLPQLHTGIFYEIHLKVIAAFVKHSNAAFLFLNIFSLV